MTTITNQIVALVDSVSANDAILGYISLHSPWGESTDHPVAALKVAPSLALCTSASFTTHHPPSRTFSTT